MQRPGKPALENGDIYSGNNCNSPGYRKSVAGSFLCCRYDKYLLAQISWNAFSANLREGGSLKRGK
jgi:hypothetical protein